jgi:hypothetical protein
VQIEELGEDVPNSWCAWPSGWAVQGPGRSEELGMYPTVEGVLGRAV